MNRMASNATRIPLSRVGFVSLMVLVALLFISGMFVVTAQSSLQRMRRDRISLWQLQAESLWEAGAEQATRQPIDQETVWDFTPAGQDSIRWTVTVYPLEDARRVSVTAVIASAAKVRATVRRTIQIP